jgi:DnaJ-class molecular chaperone
MSVPCPACNGTGTLTKETGPLWWQRQTFRCDYCIGTGRVERETA